MTFISRLTFVSKVNKKRSLYRCICEKEIVYLDSEVKNGRKRSCGCLKPKSPIIVIDGSKNKFCTNCKEFHDINRFGPKDKKGSIVSYCRESKRESVNNYVRIRRSTDPEFAQRMRDAKKREKNRDAQRKRYNLKLKERMINDPEYAKAYRRKKAEKYNNRFHTDINFRITKNIRRRVLLSLHGLSKSENTLKLIGCSIEDLRKHLENQFMEGMNWENYGKDWCIDHIKPLISFNLIDPQEQKIAFHFSNIQPLWLIDNLKKGAKLDWKPITPDPTEIEVNF